MERYAGLAPLPARIERLPELAVDLWWSWHHEARMVFRMLDYPLWRATAHNPVHAVGGAAGDARARDAGSRLAAAC